MLIAALVVCLAFAGCGGGSSNASLRVVLDADALECDGTRVRTIDVSRYDTAFTTPALEIRKAMRCTLQFLVVNAGASAVVLDAATVAGVGPAAGAGVRATELTPLGAKPLHDESEGTVEAVFSMDSYPLDAGAAEEFAVVLEYHRGCTPASSNINFSDSPSVTTEGGDEASVFGPAYAFIGTKDTNCAE